jgi:hypothetical protein
MRRRSRTGCRRRREPRAGPDSPSGRPTAPRSTASQSDGAMSVGTAQDSRALCPLSRARTRARAKPTAQMTIAISRSRRPRAAWRSWRNASTPAVVQDTRFTSASPRRSRLGEVRRRRPSGTNRSPAAGTAAWLSGGDRDPTAAVGHVVDAAIGGYRGELFSQPRTTRWPHTGLDG